MGKRVIRGILGLFVIITVGCTTGRGRTEDCTMQDMIDYMVEFHFDNNIIWHTTSRLDTWLGNSLPEGYTSIVFVHSEAEAVGFPDDVVIAWPSKASFRIYQTMIRSDTDLEEFGINLPLKAESLVDDWRKIWTLAESLEFPFRARNREFHSDELSLEMRKDRSERAWLFPGRLDALNALLKERNLGEVYMVLIARYVPYSELTIDDFPTVPFTEEDVRNDPLLIQRIARESLTDEELKGLPGHSWWLWL